MLTGLIAADGVTTQMLMSRGSDRAGESNPLARPFVTHGAPGQAAACVMGLGASIAIAYLLHKTGHHSIEVFVLHAAVGVEAVTVTSNIVENTRGLTK